MAKMSAMIRQRRFGIERDFWAAGIGFEGLC
jgi:hypothetical protein